MGDGAVVALAVFEVVLVACMFLVWRAWKEE